MRKILLIAVGGYLATTIGASAQAPKSPDGPPAGAPGIEKGVPPGIEKGAPAQGKDIQAPPSGQKGVKQEQPTTEKRASEQAPRQAAPQQKADPKEAQRSPAGDGQKNVQGNRDADRSGSSGTSTGTGSVQGAGGEAPKSGGAGNVTQEQRQKIQTVFSKHRTAAVANFNVRLTVGATVPRTVHLAPIPEEIVVIVPEYRRYRYVVVEEVVYIVDPQTYVVVEVITLT